MLWLELENIVNFFPRHNCCSAIQLIQYLILRALLAPGLLYSSQNNSLYAVVLWWNFSERIKEWKVRTSPYGASYWSKNEENTATIEHSPRNVHEEPSVRFWMASLESCQLFPDVSSHSLQLLLLIYWQNFVISGWPFDSLSFPSKIWNACQIRKIPIPISTYQKFRTFSYSRAGKIVR